MAHTAVLLDCIHCYSNKSLRDLFLTDFETPFSTFDKMSQNDCEQKYQNALLYSIFENVFLFSRYSLAHYTKPNWASVTKTDRVYFFIDCKILFFILSHFYNLSQRQLRRYTCVYRTHSLWLQKPAQTYLVRRCSMQLLSWTNFYLVHTFSLCWFLSVLSLSLASIVFSSLSVCLHGVEILRGVDTVSIQSPGISYQGTIKSQCPGARYLIGKLKIKHRHFKG